MTRYIGLFELVAAIRAEAKPLAPSLALEPGRIELSADQFAAVDETMEYAHENAR